MHRIKNQAKGIKIFDHIFSKQHEEVKVWHWPQAYIKKFKSVSTIQK